jgi:hypothetical protein
MALAALVVMAPLWFHYAAHPTELAGRSRQVSIFASGWLEREQQVTERSAASLLLEQFWKSISAFNYTLDPTFWYHPGIPLLDFVGGVTFILGLMWATLRWRRPSNGLLLIWFWLALILGWTLTENPPSSQRLTIVAPALAMLVGLGIAWLSRVLLHLQVNAVQRSRVTGILLIAIITVNVYYYFGIYARTRIYGNPTAEVATELGRYLASRDDDYVVYFHAPPFMYWGFGTLTFLTREGTRGVVEGMDVPPEGITALPTPDARRGARFVFLPERLEELTSVRARFPTGVEKAVHSTDDGRLLYVLYEVEVEVKEQQ